MSADDVCKKVSAILREVVRGGPKYGTPDGFTRWGAVEADIHAAIRSPVSPSGAAQTPEKEQS